MLDRLTAAWHALIGSKQADWRPISPTSDPMPWLDHLFVVTGPSTGPGGTRSRWSSYEGYVGGQLVCTRPRLADAQEMVEGQAGRVLTWRKIQMDPQVVEHYYFGPTSEFGINTYWIGE